MAKFVFNAGVFKDSPLFAASTATQVTVLDRADDTLASIWSDRDGASVKANPFYISEAGQITFYADAGRYQVTATNGGFTRVWEDVILIDPNAAAGGAVWGDITGTLSDQTDLQSALDALGPAFTIGSGITASGSAADGDWAKFRKVTGSGTVVWSVPNTLSANFVTFIKVDESFSGTFTIASGTGTPDVNPPYGKTLVVPAGGTVAIVRFSSTVIDVIGDGVAA